MLYPIIMFMISGFLGTVLALRLMALDAQQSKTKLTKRGKIVISIAVGISVALFVIFLNGFWWDCDLTNRSRACRVIWGY